MRLLSAIEILSLFMILAALIGLVLCVVSLFRAMGGRRNIPYVSASFLLIPVVFLLASKFIVVEILDKSIIKDVARVTVSPKIAIDPKLVLLKAFSNIYRVKGASGSHPVQSQHVFEVCAQGDCFVIVVAQDSRDSEMYWVSYEPFSGVSVPLGYTRLGSKKI
jgi:hypothetical protein